MTTLLLVAFLTHPTGALGLLAADDFEAREYGSTVLEAWGDVAIPVLHVGKTSDDREVRRRAQELIVANRARMWERLRPFPEIDSLWYYTGPDLNGYHSQMDKTVLWNEAHALGAMYLDKSFNNYAGGWLYRNYVIATELMISDLIDQGVPEWALALLLKEMRRRDTVYFERNWSGCDWRHECWGLPPTPAKPPAKPGFWGIDK